MRVSAASTQSNLKVFKLHRYTLSNTKHIIPNNQMQNTKYTLSHTKYMTQSNLKESKGFYCIFLLLFHRSYLWGNSWKGLSLRSLSNGQILTNFFFWDPFPERNTILQDVVHISKKFDRSEKCTKSLIYSKLVCVAVSTKRAQYW